MTEHEAEIRRLIKVALSAANKLHVNRECYGYEWMKHISWEIVLLEHELAALRRMARLLDSKVANDDC